MENNLLVVGLFGFLSIIVLAMIGLLNSKQMVAIAKTLAILHNRVTDLERRIK